MLKQLLSQIPNCCGVRSIPKRRAKQSCNLMKLDIDTKQLNTKINDAIDQGLHSLDQGLRRLEEVRDTVAGNVKKQHWDKDVKKKWKQGRARVIDAEHAVESHVKENTTLYIAAGVGLLALVLAKVAFTRRRLSR